MQRNSIEVSKAILKARLNFRAMTPMLNKAFATSNSEGVAQNYQKFKSKYAEHVSNFQQKVAQLERANAKEATKPTGTVYQNPYHSDHHPLNFSSVKNAELFHDFIGPEQVSPHYENFMVARKFALGFIGTLALLSIGSATVDLHWIMKSTLIPFFFWMQIMYMYLEGRKSFFKPLLQRFYRRVAMNEIYNFEVFYHENIENKLRELLRISKSQMEFWNLHSEYQNVKAESVNNFLANEHANLQGNITQRALNILQSASTQETLNKSKYLQSMIDEAQSEIDAQLNGPNAAKIQQDMLASAIQGIAQGQMTYENDPILPIVTSRLRANVEKVNSMSEEEQLKIVALTEAQLQFIKEQDATARRDYLNQQPAGLDSSLKNNESLKRMFDRWGKQ